jgi:hypothetical protein
MMNRYSAHVENWKSKRGNAFGLKLRMKSKLKFKGRVDPRYGVIMNFCADVKDEIVSKLEAFRKANPSDDQKGFKNMSKKQAATVQELKGGKMGILKPSDKSMGTAISTSKKVPKGNLATLVRHQNLLSIRRRGESGILHKSSQTPHRDSEKT